MHTKVLSQWLDDRAAVGHATRAAALTRVVRALLSGGKLSLTHLGRSLSGSAHVKHQIKAVDRLLGNEHLQAERDGIYRAITTTLLLGNKRPVIIVDWSDFELGRRWLMLKAAVPVGGRAISLYERVFPFKRYNSPGAHREFLEALHSILQDGCLPIIVTDAGFRGPWFREVEAYGWDCVGRIRNKVKYYSEKSRRWCFTDSLYPKATAQSRSSAKPRCRAAARTKFGCTSSGLTSLVLVDRPVGDPRDRERPCTVVSTEHPGCSRRRCLIVAGPLEE